MRKKTLLKVMAAFMVVGGITAGNLGTAKVNAYVRYPYYNWNLVANGDFKDESGMPWILRTTDPTTAESEIKNGTYKVTVRKLIENSRDTRWSAQLFQYLPKLKNGHNYKVKFTVKADHDCKVYPTIIQRDGNYDEYWNGEGTIQNGQRTWEPVELKAGVAKTVTGTFFMNKDEDRAELNFHLAGDCAPEAVREGSEEPYSYEFSNISLEAPEFCRY